MFGVTHCVYVCRSPPPSLPTYLSTYQYPGNTESIKAWKMICMKSRVEFQAIYNLLHVDLSERGESFYNPYLPGVVHQLEAAGTLVESNGAKCVFLDGYNNSDGTPMPLVMILIMMMMMMMMMIRMKMMRMIAMMIMMMMIKMKMMRMIAIMIMVMVMVIRMYIYTYDDLYVDYQEERWRLLVRYH